MLVYHGSHMNVKTPDINYGRFNLDFGKGFYVTTLQKQADKWARRKTLIENEKLSCRNEIVNSTQKGIDALNFIESYEV